MKTTIDIPEKTLKDALKFTKAKTKREAVVSALEDFNRRQAMAELTKYSGTFTSLMTNDEIEDLQAQKYRRFDPNFRFTSQEESRRFARQLKREKERGQKACG